MADIAITSIKLVSGQLKDNLICGETIALGAPVYSDSADQDKLKNGDGTDSGKDDIVGIALIAGEAGHKGVVAIDGCRVKVDATLTVGEQYVLSASGTAGKIAPIGDLIAGNYPCTIFTAVSTSEATVKIHRTGVAKA